MTLKSMRIVIWGQRSFWLYILQMTVFASLAIVDTDFAQGSSHYAALDHQKFSPWPTTTTFCLARPIILKALLTLHVSHQWAEGQFVGYAQIHLLGKLAASSQQLADKHCAVIVDCPCNACC